MEEGEGSRRRENENAGIADAGVVLHRCRKRGGRDPHLAITREERGRRRELCVALTQEREGRVKEKSGRGG